MLGERLLYCGSLVHAAKSKTHGPRKRDEWFLLILLTAVLLWLFHAQAYGGTVSIPGSDASNQLNAAGTLLRIVDSVLFSWGARIFAGLCIMSAGWNLKEQRFGIAILCIVAALVLGTAPTWVKDIFNIGGGGGIFSQGIVPKKRALDA